MWRSVLSCLCTLRTHDGFWLGTLRLYVAHCPYFRGLRFASYLPRLDLTDRTEYVMKNLIERGYSLFTTAKRDFVRVVKRTLCDLALGFVLEQKSTADSSDKRRPATLQMVVSSQPNFKDKEAAGTHNTSFSCGFRGTSNLDDSTRTVVSAEAVEVHYVSFVLVNHEEACSNSSSCAAGTVKFSQI